VGINIAPRRLALSSSAIDLTGVTDDRPVTIRRPGVSVWRLGREVRNFARYSGLYLTLTEHRIRVRYKQSVLGVAWAILQPLLMMFIFTVVFSRIAGMATDGVPYSLFAFSGLLLWSFVSTSLSNATHSLVAHAQLITKVYFPREILPLSYVTAALFDLLVGSVVLLMLLAWHDRAISVYLLWAVPVIAIAALFTTAIALILSALQVRFRDVGLAVPLGLYLWMFCTPIAYPLNAVPERYRILLNLNPLTGIIEAFRSVVIEQHPPMLAPLLLPMLTTAVILPIAYGLFKRAEATIADVI
jgi:lipopolysaccharide transport system permease protein